MIATNTAPFSQQHIRHLMQQMGSKNAAERETALLELRSYGSSALEPLLQFADAEYIRWGKRAMLMLGLQTLPCNIVMQMCHGMPFIARILLGVCTGIPFVLLMGKLLTRNLWLNEIIGVLAEYKDVRVVRYLLQAQYLPNKSIRQASKAALLHLLPRMKASDFIGFDERQHIWMRQLLLKKDPELAIACLRALAWTTDNGAVKQVQKLMTGKAKIAQNPEVQKAAQDCLYALEARLKGITPDAILLRGASPPQKADVLLRPADATDHTEPQQLLRASRDSLADC